MRTRFYKACRDGDAREALALARKEPNLALDANDDLKEFGEAGLSGLAEAVRNGHFELAEALHPFSGAWWRATDNSSDSPNLGIWLCVEGDPAGLRWMEGFARRIENPQIVSSIGEFYQWRSLTSSFGLDSVLSGLRSALRNDATRVQAALAGFPAKKLDEALISALWASRVRDDEDATLMGVPERLACAAVFLGMGANPNARLSNQTPMDMALTLGSLDGDREPDALAAIELLLGHGADPLALDARGLHWSESAKAAGLHRVEAMLLSAQQRALLDGSTPTRKRQASRSL